MSYRPPSRHDLHRIPIELPIRGLLSLVGCAAYVEPGYGRPYHHYAYRYR